MTKATKIAYKTNQGSIKALRQMVRPRKAKRSHERARGANKLTNTPENGKR